MERPGRPPRIAKPAGVLALAALPFLVRALYAIEARSQPYLSWDLLVSYLNHQFASDLATGSGAPYALYRSPFYPLLVSLVYRMTDAGPDAVRIIQWLLGGCGCLLAADLASRIFGRVAGVVTLVLGALCAPALFFDGELLEQSAATFGLVLAVWLLIRFAATSWHVAAAGGAAIAYGLAFMMRPDLLLSLPLLAAGAVCLPGGTRPRVLRLACFGLGCLVMALMLTHPGLFMRVSASHLDINAAINLYLGNNPESTGLDPRFPEIAELDTTEPDARRDHMTGLDLAGVRYAMGRTGGDISTVAPYWIERTRAFVTSDPSAWLALESRKMLLFFDGFVHSNQKDIYVARSLSTVLSLLVFCLGVCVPLGLIIPLAGLGSAAPMARAHRLLLLAVPAGCLVTTLIFFHDERFRYPAVPFLTVLAAAGVTRLAASAARTRWRSMILLVPLLTLSNVDWLGTHTVRWAAERFRMGTMYEEQGDDRAAADAYLRSIAADPGYQPALDNLVTLAVRTGSVDDSLRALESLDTSDVRPPVFVTSLATLHEAAGDTTGASAVLMEALRHDPGDPTLALASADLRLRQDRCIEALPLFEVAIAGGGPPGAFAGAAFCRSRAGDDSGALEPLRQGLERYPRDLTLLGMLAELNGRTGRHAEEQSGYRAILAIDPSNAEAMMRLARSLAVDGVTAEARALAQKALALGHPDAKPFLRTLPPESEPSP